VIDAVGCDQLVSDSEIALVEHLLIRCGEIAPCLFLLLTWVLTPLLTASYTWKTLGGYEALSPCS
jgi:hypothetical protein